MINERDCETWAQTVAEFVSHYERAEHKTFRDREYITAYTHKQLIEMVNELLDLYWLFEYRGGLVIVL